MPRRAAVLVLGDLGRSPRMLYHARALAESGVDVELIGYSGHELPQAVATHARIRVHFLSPPWRQSARGKLYALAVLADLPLQASELLRMFAAMPPPDVILVQNPPALPSLPIAHLVARLKGARLIVDWHNFSEDMLALRLGRAHPLVRWLGKLEGAMGRRGHAHLCVSRAMQTELNRRFGVRDAHVFYDRPPVAPAGLSDAERADLFRKLGLDIDPNAPGRAPIIVSASSWSADEDFRLLLDAMHRLDDQQFACWFLLTGDGPRRRAWEESAERSDFRHVRYRTLWVPAEDYLALLGCGDLGVSLHRSASGFDLPMKICDMKSAGLPICALDYGSVLREFVTPGTNGFLFSDAVELAEQIQRLFASFPAVSKELSALRDEVRRESQDGWDAGWKREAQPVFA